MHTIVNAVLNCGLVNVPVGVASAASRNDLKLRTLHGECMTPIKQQNVCPHCGVILENGDVVKGFEFVKDQFVVIDKDELEQVGAARSKVIELTKFVERSDLSPVLFDKTYNLVPAKGLIGKSYLLMRDTMIKTSLAGLGTASLWGKEYPCLVYPQNGVLVLSMLFCADEVRDVSEITKLLAGQEVDSEQLVMAERLVTMLKQPVEPEDLLTASRARITSFVAAKVAGGTVEMPVEEQPQMIPDLTESLRLTLELSEVA